MYHTMKKIYLSLLIGSSFLFAGCSASSSAYATTQAERYNTYNRPVVTSDNRREIVAIYDYPHYLDLPYYLYNGKYFYGGTYKHGRYYHRGRILRHGYYYSRGYRYSHPYRHTNNSHIRKRKRHLYRYKNHNKRYKQNYKRVERRINNYYGGYQNNE